MSNNRGLAALSSLAQVARWMLVVYMLVDGLSACVTAWVAWQEFHSYVGNIDRALGLFAAVGMLVWIVAIPTTLVYFLWLYRARRNLVEMAVGGLHYSPGWTIGSYFVPFVNLVLPFRTMKELYNRSQGEPEELAFVTVEDASGWWACLIGSLLLNGAWYFLLLINSIPGMFVIMPPGTHSLLLLISQLLAVGANWFLFRLVGGVTRAQNSGAFVGDTFG
ncbi:MAG: DUF4328 domain-containing protein [Sphingomonadales bacterium]|nr:DUF4328 domain-containing protein [Sphingomonadales bacterium]MBD3772561.1 DUF4328 domain-containing protein [Paracoccaceae bacterium]